jgi:hypothetical protein
MPGKRPSARIDADDMIRSAELTTGLSDWGNDEWRAPFHALVDSLNNDSALHEAGSQRTRLKLNDLLCGRLQLFDDRKHYPAISAEEITQPIVVVGFPRAGSTFFYNLAAQDPEHLSPKMWEIMFPSPPPEEQVRGGSPDPRIAKCQDRLEQLGLLGQDIRQMHTFGAERAEECLFMWEYTFLSINFLTYWSVGSYLQKCMANVDQTKVYRQQKMFLQQLQFRKRTKQWLLKSPAHDLFLEELTSVFPDARFVWTHRDPARVVASLFKLYPVLHRPFSDADGALSGHDVLQSMADHARMGMEFRSRPGNEARFYDAHYVAVQLDPLGAMRDMYAKFGIELSREREQILAQWLEGDQKKHKATGTHNYSLEEAGLDYGDIDRAFGEYIARYNIALER